MGLRLQAGDVTVLLGPDAVRREVMDALDDGSARCASGHTGVPVHRLVTRACAGLAERMDAVETARTSGAALVLVDRVTDGLPAAARRAVLSAVRGVAGPGRAVLVDDSDPVAALSVADGALRADPAGRLVPEQIAAPDYLAS
ncbi:hypothetical protein GB931_09275 [Modestobacter sp. I12A-02628]|uniref:Uncharacterized protein n=1 Tax=Goekera deserti TaxID=2497753 RepID=A0A7K3WEE2_9ACTN|nr:hypothetical protein [Goekera deserti]MPQ98108.1 hypothetical protein [Goekera deserti]NDI48756.1 hypothetical protein [Goekera deserti]NEL54865.1 hypothetical protein [Goekera deserti]